MLKKSFSLMVVLLVFALLTASPAYAKEMMEPTKAAELKMTLRDLWLDHIFWVRSVVFTMKFGDADAAKVAEENVVNNAKEITAAVGSFYGKEAGDKLFGLLAGHYGAVKEYLTTSLKENNEAKYAAVEKIRKNAEEIATLLSGANPKNWQYDTLFSLLLAHGAHHVSEIDAVATKNFSAEAKMWETMKNHIYTIADVLAGGIVKQFPKKF